MKNLPMRFHGKVYQDGKFWLAKVPVLDTITQGRTCKEALAMVKDLLEILANPPRVYGGGTPRAAWGV
jgi:predicted RNase H-like HicB family nuclease